MLRRTMQQPAPVVPSQALVAAVLYFTVLASVLLAGVSPSLSVVAFLYAAFPVGLAAVVLARLGRRLHPIRRPRAVRAAPIAGMPRYS